MGRRAHPTYKTMSASKPKNGGPWRPGKKVGHTFNVKGSRVRTRGWKSQPSK
jgi:hypothetical protein